MLTLSLIDVKHNEIKGKAYDEALWVHCNTDCLTKFLQAVQYQMA